MQPRDWNTVDSNGRLVLDIVVLDIVAERTAEC